VEHQLVEREVEVLRLDQSQHPDLDLLRRRLARTKRKLKETEDELSERNLEIERLKKRLRSRGRDNDGGLAALGLLASQVLSEEMNDSSQKSEASGVGGGEGGGGGSSSQKSNSQKAAGGLMSPVAFKTGDKRRRGSASTIEMDDNDDEEEEDEDDVEMEEHPEAEPSDAEKNALSGGRHMSGRKLSYNKHNDGPYRSPRSPEKVKRK